MTYHSSVRTLVGITLRSLGLWLCALIALPMQAQVEWPAPAGLYSLSLGEAVTTPEAIEDGGLYAIYQPRNNSFACEDASHKVLLTQNNSVPEVTDDLSYVFCFLRQDDGTYRIQAASGLYFPTPTANGNIVLSEQAGSYDLVFSEGYLFPRCTSEGVTYAIDRSGGAMYAYTSVNTTAGGAQSYQLRPVTLGSASPDLTSLAQLTTGWYRLRLTSSPDEGRYAYTSEPELVYNNKNYPIAVATTADVPEADDAAYFFHFTRSGSGFYLKLPNGHDINKVSPTSFIGISTMTISKDDDGFYFNSGRYFKPMTLSGQYALGETATDGARYAIERVSLSALDLQPWTVTIRGGQQAASLPANNTSLLYQGDDAKGITRLYNTGTLFLPTGAVPTAEAFTVSGGNEGWQLNVDADSHTIKASQLGLVTQGYQTTSVGAEAAMLLRIKLLRPTDSSCLLTGLTVALDESTRRNVESLTLVRCASPEIYAQEELEVLGTAAVTDSEQLTIPLAGTEMTEGYNQLWLLARVRQDACIGDVINASLVSYDYTASDEPATIDLTSVTTGGQQGARIYAAQSYPFLPTTYGSRCYRIPAMVTATDGSLVVAADKRYDSHNDIGVPANHVIDIVVRRSTDGGRTWSEPVTVAKGQGSTDTARCGYGDPSLTVGADGRIYCLFGAGNTGFTAGLKRIAMSTSDDNGLTWTEPVDLYATDAITDHTEHGLFSYFVTSGRGLCTSDGVLMYLLCSRAYTDAEQTASSTSNTDYVFYSTDQGSTWHIDATAVYTGGDEAKLTQLADGSLLASVRQGGGRGFVRGTYSHNDDGTLTFSWEAQQQNATLAQGGSACNHDILRYELGDVAMPYVYLHTLTGTGFQNLRIYMSLDEGASWTLAYTLQPGGARYATLTQLANGDLGILFEDGQLGQSTTGNESETGSQYPINYITLTREQLLEAYQAVREATLTVVIAQQGDTNGPSSYGTFASTGWTNQWTATQPATVAGLTLTAAHNAFSVANVYSTRVLALKPSEAGAADAITITAPKGYLIDSYQIGGFFYTATEKYTLTSADGELSTSIDQNSGQPSLLTVEQVYEPTTTLTLTSLGTTNDRYACITDFRVRLIEEWNPVAVTAPRSSQDVDNQASSSRQPASLGTTVYDLAGRRVARPAHGVYIVRGRKVVR